MSSAEPYWFQKPSVLFVVPPDPIRCAKNQISNGGAQSGSAVDNNRTVAQKLGDAFLPSTQQTITSPTNINRITRIIWLIAIILSLALWSWLPVGIVAAVTLLALLIGVGLTVYDERDKRASAAAATCNKSAEDFARTTAVQTTAPSVAVLSAGTDRTSALQEESHMSNTALLSETKFENFRTHTPMANASVFMPPKFPPTIADDAAICNSSSWQTSSYVPNEFNRSHNPALAASVDMNRRDFTLPNPMRHNSYENVDARYRRYEMQPHPIETEEAVVAEESVNAAAAAERSEVDTPVPLEITSCDAPICAPESAPNAIINKMFCDQNSYGWNETVKNRALDWRSNPNDPRNRQRELEFAQKRQSIRSLQWNQGP